MVTPLFHLTLPKYHSYDPVTKDLGRHRGRQNGRQRQQNRQAALAHHEVINPKDRPYIGLIYGRYLQFRFLKFILIY